jgi:hypothetical protein
MERINDDGSAELADAAQGLEAGIIEMGVFAMVTT